jgi:MoaA/NifB/PqqE/SkfB family radical SAM enzyme
MIDIRDSKDEQHMDNNTNLIEYLNNGIETIVKGAVRASLKNPRESIFIAKFVLANKRAEKIRGDFERKGRHIPSFLIASITKSCNLNCTGCYARAIQGCKDNNESDVKDTGDSNNTSDGKKSSDGGYDSNGKNNSDCKKTDASLLESGEWSRIFKEAEEVGINFILLAGGEPLLRQDVIEAASKFRNVVFPVFTNGTLLDGVYMDLFDSHRNLIPVLSIEGDIEETDSRRGAGIFAKLTERMSALKKRGILYGASITVTKENILNVTSDSFISSLYDKGCKVIIFVEYVPVSADTVDIAPGDAERELLESRLVGIRALFDDCIIVSFPGDEKASGGCLAAGRGFFHINANGCAEPCPFSPYSDTNIKNISLLQALDSPLFRKIQSGDMLIGEHQGGCVLFEQEEAVKKLL